MKKSLLSLIFATTISIVESGYCAYPPENQEFRFRQVQPSILTYAHQEQYTDIQNLLNQYTLDQLKNTFATFVIEDVAPKTTLTIFKTYIESIKDTHIQQRITSLLLGHLLHYAAAYGKVAYVAYFLQECKKNISEEILQHAYTAAQICHDQYHQNQIKKLLEQCWYEATIYHYWGCPLLTMACDCCKSIF
jgi:hypothetical protein